MSSREERPYSVRMTDTLAEAEVKAAEAAVHAKAWPWWGRVAFRFSFIYWILYMLPAAGAVSVIDLWPWGTEKLSQWLSWPLARLAHWAGVHVLHLTGPRADWHPTGSGDTAMNYVSLGCIAVLALVGAAVWTAVDDLRANGRREYRTAYAWLRLFLRFTLALTLLEYGFIKIYPGQFGVRPRLFELNETYGESSPMHVLWFFMTVSRSYTIFGGLMEAVPGVLLLFRRTSTAGLLGAVAVMSNVVAMNFCYDVPVKLYSVNLLLMALYLLLPDLKPMWRFFVARQDAALTGVWVRRMERKPLRVGAHVLQGLVLLSCIWSFGVQMYRNRMVEGSPSPLRGVWAVDALQGWPGARPKAVTFDSKEYALVNFEDGKRRYLSTTYDAASRRCGFPTIDKETQLQWDVPQNGKMGMHGKWSGAVVTVAMHRTDPDSYLLTSRGFHWVQENPFNR